MKIEVKGLTRTYTSSHTEVKAIQNASFTIMPGDQVMVVGPSGAGKSTLLNILGLFDRQYEGTYLIDGRDVNQLREQEIAHYRNQRFAYVFQDYLLLDDETVYNNIKVPLLYSKRDRRDFHAMIEQIAKAVGIETLLQKKARHLSGGERQRVAIARAFVNEPEVILADEPTGALDPLNREIILELIYDYLNPKRCLIFVTHDLERNRRGKQRIFEVNDGFVTAPAKE